MSWPRIAAIVLGLLLLSVIVYGLINPPPPCRRYETRESVCSSVVFVGGHSGMDIHACTVQVCVEREDGGAP